VPSLDDVLMKRERVVAGLMTGTSMDGLDVAICRIERGEQLLFELLAFETVPMPWPTSSQATHMAWI